MAATECEVVLCLAAAECFDNMKSKSQEMFEVKIFDCFENKQSGRSHVCWYHCEKFLSQMEIYPTMIPFVLTSILLRAFSLTSVTWSVADVNLFLKTNSIHELHIIMIPYND